MNQLQLRRSLAMRVAAALFVIAVSGCSALDSTSSPRITERIKNATTRSDHLGLAEYYDRETQTARQKAAQHLQMRESYRGRVGVGRGGPELQTSILRHCDDLVLQHERSAVEYESLASLHRRLASEAAR